MANIGLFGQRNATSPDKGEEFRRHVAEFTTFDLVIQQRPERHAMLQEAAWQPQQFLHPGIEHHDPVLGIKLHDALAHIGQCGFKRRVDRLDLGRTANQLGNVCQRANLAPPGSGVALTRKIVPSGRIR